MKRAADPSTVYLEIGSKKTFAGAVEWPGWCRGGRDEQAAMAALLAYAPRYARVLGASGLDFDMPVDLSAFSIVERLAGSATTDFGVPAAAPSGDSRLLDDAELARLRKIVEACWQAFDAAVAAAQGKDLSKGPRGGGREVEAIVQHVVEAEWSYLGQLGWNLKTGQKPDPHGEPGHVRHAILEALTSADALAALPSTGPRGGTRWRPRYFVRRVAWHVLDHAWEIEDRTP